MCMKDKNGICIHDGKDRTMWRMLFDDKRGRMWRCILCGMKWGYKA